MRRILRTAYRVMAALPALFILAVNVRLYHAARPASPAALAEAKSQLAFIRASLDGGSGAAMQSLFPEGYLFTHAQYGLTWADVGLADAQSRPDALRETRWALAQLEMPEGSAPFPPDLDPPYGVFYNGWTAWLEGRIMRLQGREADAPADVAAYQGRCDALAAAFERGRTPFLMAYTGQAWPVDSVVAIAALRQHDRLFPPRYEAVIERWEEAARQRLDPATGLLPHRVDPDTGAPLEGARGSSQSVINRFLPEIDPVWAADQYARFRAQFVSIPLGVREYPAGDTSPGDVDSGPLVLGISASASVVSIGVARANRDEPLAAALSGGAEAVGLPLEWGGRKFYGLGLLPVGDAMLAWSRAALPPQEDPPIPPPDIVPGWWQWPLHAFSLLVLILLWSPEWISYLRSVRSRGASQFISERSQR